MAVVNKWMPSAQHGYRGLSVTIQHRQTDTGRHAYDEVSQQEKGRKTISANGINGQQSMPCPVAACISLSILEYM